MLSLPSASRRIRIVHFLVNTLLLLAAVDFVAHPYFDPASDVIFTRVGAVYPDGAKITVRYPEPNTTENTVKVVWRQFKEDTLPDAGWKDGPAFKLTAENDWVSTRKLGGLWPSTVYECDSFQLANKCVLFD